MSTILVVDDMPVIREPIAAALRAKGYNTLCAGDGKEALTLLRQAIPELILLDLSMPGMDGMAVLRALRNDPATLSIPVILLTGSSEKDKVIEAGKLGVRDYVLKTRFSLPDLLSRVQKHLGSAIPSEGAQPPPPQQNSDIADPTRMAGKSGLTSDAQSFAPLTRQQTIDRVEACTQTKTLPGAVAEVMALVNSPRTDVSDLVAVLKRDPVLATRVLHLANSAAFASQKPRIATIEEAVRNIGTAGVRAMVISVGIFESFPPQGANGLPITRCWQHSFAMASVMEKLAHSTNKIDPGMAHLTGLCYDLCDIVLRQHFATEYQGMCDIMARTGKPAWQVRTGVFGMPFHELVALVLGKLNLPPAIVAPIADAFSRSSGREEFRPCGPMARALRIANVYAHGLMLAAGPDAPVLPISTAEYRSTFGDAPPPDFDPAILRSEALTAVNLLAGVSAVETAELCRPAIRPSAGRILYWRHPSYCDLDPLAALLSFAGEIGIVNSPNELSGYDVLIVAAPRQEAAARQELAVVTALLTCSAPVLFLGGLPAHERPTKPQITVRPLPISLSEAATFFSSVRPTSAAA